MCSTIMAALPILAIAPLSLRFAPCPVSPGTCLSLSISLLQSTRLMLRLQDPAMRELPFADLFLARFS